MKHNKDVTSALREAGAVPIRQAKHGMLYRLPNGSTWLAPRDQGRSHGGFARALQLALRKASA